MGRLDPAAMIEEMNDVRPGLFDDWVNFYRAEPFGPGTTNLMLARVASSLGGGSERDYLPKIGDE